MNQAGYDLLKEWERLELVAYQDEGGVWTQGYGHTGAGVSPNDPWTQANADYYLQQDVSRTVDELLDLIDPELTDNQFSAMVCLAYNIGTGAFAGSSVLHIINDYGANQPSIPIHILVWNKVRINGVLHVSRGLVRRRQAECELWSKP